MTALSHLTPVQEKKLFDTITSSRDTALIFLVVHYGLYVSEVVSLTVADYNAVEKTIRINGSRARHLCLSDDAARALDQWVSDRPHVGTSTLFVTLKGKVSALTSRGIDAILRKWGEKSKLGVINFRTLRKTALRYQSQIKFVSSKTTNKADTYDELGPSSNDNQMPVASHRLIPIALASIGACLLYRLLRKVR